MSLKSDNSYIYIQIAEQLKQQVEQGIYKEKEKLPSEFELCKQLSVKREELREALDILEEDNIVTRRPGVGIFVNPKPMFSSGIEQLGSVTDMITKSGKTPGSQYISTELIEPTDNDKQRFAPKRVKQIAQIERIRSADGEPVVYCIDKVDKDLIPLDQVHTQDSLFKLLEVSGGKKIAYAITYIEPIGYHEKISPALNCQPDQALLLLKQVHYTALDEPVLYSANYFRSDVFSFFVVRKR
ncbi:GntR family transcriptional regulator [Aquibacillus koreensis]|uniref:GntR family transcriptional regulator n=1 Tax=Aquibacillus koreensis TaxID=279446 RepID=A0A9X4AKX1_9BACI|nr:GntR family transcriptional regulator [Aquibacillus koreensis]MCT2534583.1 GntR family transcriptional regulator [Aquibacillus koreensis]MDC3421823.1 GntR family transcriptional regulator [Aquibacillus koreensis]